MSRKRHINVNKQIVPNKNDDNTDNDITTEKVYIQYFDLSIEKYIEEVKVNINGTETTRKVGYEEKGNLVKVDVKKSEAKSTKLTITYGMVIKNVGEIPGYATEITEYTNDYDAEDLTKDNKDGEDLLVTLKTGSQEVAGITVLAVFTSIVALGVLVIKRKVK